MTERVRKLRELLLEGTHRAYRIESTGLTILDHETEKMPFPVRKALAFAKMLETMPIFIQEGELMLGGKTVYALPEHITEHEKEIGNHHIETHGYANMFDVVFNLGQDGRGFGIPNSSNPAYYWLLDLGFPAMLSLAEEKRKAAAGDEKEAFYHSVVITYKAILALLKRFEDLARERRLERIPEIFQALQNRAPSDFREALQFVYTIQYLVWLEGAFLIPLGRFDQYLFKFYDKDVHSGKLSREAALELIECFFIKLNYEIDRTHGDAGKFESDTGQSITIGGVLPQSGKDATNELTYLCLDAVKDLRLTDPKVHLRINSETPERLWMSALELSSMGMGFPTYDNDDAIIPALLNVKGCYSLEDARDYCGSGCWEIIIQGRSFNRNLGMIDGLRALEWTLFNGENILQTTIGAPGMINGKWGIETGDPENFETFDELFNAFKVQIKHNIDMVSTNCNKAMLTWSPFYSSVLEDCMMSGKDIRQGGCRYNETDFQMSSLTNCADALYAIKKIVYDDRKLTLKEFTEILKDNFKSNDLLKMEIVNKIPKFGNDVDEVDLIAKDIVDYFTREVEKHTNSFNGPYRARISSALGYIALAEKLGASADGRGASEAYANNLSPHLGADRNGPTAVIKSASKLDFSHCAGGSVLDLKFNPSVLATAEGKSKFADFIKTYFDLGGMQIQFNFVDGKMLEEAKKRPDDYKGLIVRVWGFSTYFVSLPEKYQDHIIARTEYDPR